MVAVSPVTSEAPVPQADESDFDPKGKSDNEIRKFVSTPFHIASIIHFAPSRWWELII